MLKAVIFDMDGVIVDTEPEFLSSELELAAKLNLPFTRDFQKKYVGSRQEVMWEDFIKLHHVPYTVEELVGMEAEHMDAYYAKGRLVPIPGTLELIHALHNKGIALAVATSNKEINAINAIERLGIADCILTVASACRVENAKPAPDLFLLAMEELHVKAEDSVAIDDSDKGIEGARAAHLMTVGFVSPHSGEQDFSKADLVVSDMAKLTPTMLESLLDRQKIVKL